MSKIVYYTTIVILFASLNIRAQEDIKPQNYNTNFELGQKYFEKYAYRIAIKHFLKAYDEDSTSTIIQLRLAQSYYRMRDLEDAEFWGNRLIKNNYELSLDEIYYYIEILAANKHYERASYWYAQYLERDTTNETRIARMENFLQTPFYENNGESFQINMVNFNSDKRDFSPNYYKDGLVFISGRTKGLNLKKWFKNDEQYYLNVYYTESLDSIEYLEPKIFKGLKTRYHEGPLCFYDNNTKVIFTRSNIKKRSLLGKKAGLSADGSTVLKLYMADIENNKAKNIREFPYNSDEFSTGHPTVSSDGKRLIFASDRPDGLGGSDLYMSFRVNDSWTPPINLGPTVNTSEQELFPNAIGDVLYFSSDGHPGLGGLDIYFSILIDDKPTDLVNVTYPINSSSDDFGLTTKDGKSGYFSSNRGSTINDNIYYGVDVRKKPKLSLDIQVVDSMSLQTLLNPVIEITDSLTTEVLFPYQSKGDSIYSYIIDADKNYKIIASHKGYFNHTLPFNTDKSTSGVQQLKVPLSKVSPNKTIELKDIYYDFDKATLRDTSMIVINYLIKWMEENPSINIEIGAHTDNRGNADYNLNLSQRRAQSVADYLIDSGIDKLRLQTMGYGETKPKFPCENPSDCTEKEHQMNRRTEIKVITDTNITGQ
ncbi:OmpA family protein [Saccharicrinis aurantiacus]|uniref:OmpA family protein n=1 Tax=Saccharicrinis aurantiacus TaxID=1849719 RepID=UPI00249264D1|nr:OmpA family protein [Saccharicrinis aurantiacus]